MTKLEKVVKALECCNMPNNHDDCPYNGAAHYNICTHHLLTDAIALLKEQEARVLTMDEVKRLQSLRDGAIWLEAYAGLFPALPEIAMPNITYFVCIPLDGYRGWFENEWYGKTWRCWTVRPTDEQREATPWNEPPKED